MHKIWGGAIFKWGISEPQVKYFEPTVSISSFKCLQKNEFSSHISKIVHKLRMLPFDQYFVFYTPRSYHLNLTNYLKFCIIWCISHIILFCYHAKIRIFPGIRENCSINLQNLHCRNFDGSLYFAILADN